MSKYQFQQSNIYQEGTNLPINKFNITDENLLTAFENELIETAAEQYAAAILPTTEFTLAFFIAIHRSTFEILYDWAGVIRTHDMSKGGSRFCQAAYLPKELDKLFQQLKQENYLKDAAQSSKEAFAERLAYYQCELIALHPFYEINGRVTRLFFDLIAIANGYDPIDYEATLATNEKPNLYIQASIDCVQLADTRKLQNIILNGLQQRETE